MDSYRAITEAKDNLGRIRRRLRKADSALLADLNGRLEELDRALYHAKEIAGLLTTARAMRGRD